MGGIFSDDARCDDENDRGDGILGINFRLDRLKMNSGLIAGKTGVSEHRRTVLDTSHVIQQ